LKVPVIGCGLFFLAILSWGQSRPELSAYDVVDPFIGTASGGNTFPAATLPFGMIQWGPDTRNDGWYHFGDTNIRGLSLTHISGTGCPTFADVPILLLVSPDEITARAGVFDRPNNITEAISLAQYLS